MENNIIVSVLKLWNSNFTIETMHEWISNNQMWIYPYDSNYVVYGHCIDSESDSYCDVFIANLNLNITFKDDKAVQRFITDPIILIQ